jgi:hypothetical protein
MDQMEKAKSQWLAQVARQRIGQIVLVVSRLGAEYV